MSGLLCNVQCPMLHACCQVAGPVGECPPRKPPGARPSQLSLPCSALQMVHLLVDWSDRRSRRKAARGAGASAANLLSHEDQRNSRSGRRRNKAATAASASAVAAPAVAVMEKQRPGGAAVALEDAAAVAGATGPLDVETGGSIQRGIAADGGGGSSCSDDGSGGGSSCSGDGSGSVSTQVAELSSPGRLREPLDALTGAVVAATSPEVVQADRKGPPAEVRSQLPACWAAFLPWLGLGDVLFWSTRPTPCPPTCHSPLPLPCCRASQQQQGQQRGQQRGQQQQQQQQRGGR